ncbi:toxin glutamine deamidase domain-containing protein [Spirillospora sp. NPDC047418]
MGIDRPGRPDNPGDDADKPRPPAHPPGPAPDRPGQPGFPSRLESRAAARQAQEARAAELERQRTAAPENDPEPPEAPDEEPPESSPAEPTGEQRNDQDGQEEAEAADDTRETSTELGESGAAHPEPEPSGELRPDEPEAQPGAAETGEFSAEPDAEQSNSDKDEEPESPTAEDAAEEPDPPVEAVAAENPPAFRDTEPEADQAGRPDEHNQPESRDHSQPPQQDGRPSRTGAASPEAAAGQILQADRRPSLQEQASQDAPGPAPAEQPEGTPDVQPPVEGDIQRTAIGQSIAAEMPDQSDTPVSWITEPVSPEEGSTQLAPLVVDFSERNLGSQTENHLRNAENRRETSTITGNQKEAKDHQDLGEKMAELAERKIDVKIDEALDKVNPKFDVTRSAYSENCTGVVQANELQRRGVDAEAGPLEKHLRTDESGPGGRSLSTIEKAWGAKFVPGTKAEIEEAFRQPGSRGIVYIAWKGPGGGAHVFNVENVGGKVRYVDGQPTPPIRDASRYFTLGRATKYLRVDDRPTPPSGVIGPYLEP